ncbi:MAG: hypothetical protein AAF235_08340, partial [Planctomycetota bacterium]
MHQIKSPIALALAAQGFVAAASLGQPVSTVAELINAVDNGSPGDLVVVGAGTFELTAPLRPKDGMTI